MFPLEVRAQSIAVFFAIAQLFGAFGSHWYGHLIGNGTDRNSLFVGYLVGAGAMVLGGVAAIFFGVAAEGKSLEDVATPLSVIGRPPEAIFRTGVDREGIDPTVPPIRGRGRDSTMAGTESRDPGSAAAPGPHPAGGHDDPARTRAAAAGRRHAAGLAKPASQPRLAGWSKRNGSVRCRQR